MASLAFEKVIREHFDMSDRYTLKTLLTIDEADQNAVLDGLTSKLYQSIMDKVYDIDFGGVEYTKGDITKVENYEQMLECINIIKNICIEYHQSTDIPDVILTAISNIRDRKDTFERGFNLEIDLIMVLYNTLVLSIVSSVSLIISTSIEFIKDVGDSSYSVKFDKVSYVKTSQSLLFNNLKSFNRSCSVGEFDNSMEYIIKQVKKEFLGIDTLTVVGIIGATGLALSIVPALRELVFFFYHTKQSISDYFAIQADLIQMNSQYVLYNDSTGKTEKERKEIAKKQDKVVKSFRKISNAFAIDNRQTEQKAKKDIADSKKKYKVNDVVDKKLDSAPPAPVSNQSSLF